MLFNKRSSLNTNFWQSFNVFFLSMSFIFDKSAPPPKKKRNNNNKCFKICFKSSFESIPGQTTVSDLLKTFYFFYSAFWSADQLGEAGAIAPPFLDTLLAKGHRSRRPTFNILQNYNRITVLYFCCIT